MKLTDATPIGEQTINYIQKSIDVKKAVRQTDIARLAVDAELGIKSAPDNIAPYTTVIARLDEVLQVLLRAP